MRDTISEFLITLIIILIATVSISKYCADYDYYNYVRLHHLKDKEGMKQRINEILDFVELADRADDKSRKYSDRKSVV